MNTARANIDEFQVLAPIYGIMLKRKDAQKLLKLSNTAWQSIIEMGLIEPLYIDGIKSPYYSLSDLISVPDKLRKNNFFISEQL